MKCLKETCNEPTTEASEFCHTHLAEQIFSPPKKCIVFGCNKLATYEDKYCDFHSLTHDNKLNQLILKLGPI